MLYRLSYTDLKPMTGLEPATVRSNEVTVACAPGTHHMLHLPR